MRMLFRECYHIQKSEMYSLQANCPRFYDDHTTCIFMACNKNHNKFFILLGILNRSKYKTLICCCFFFFIFINIMNYITHISCNKVAFVYVLYLCLCK